jgi:hypothetical protein
MQVRPSILAFRGASFRSGLQLNVSVLGTLKYEVCPAVIDNEQYLFVDTPGFGAGITDDDNLREIWACLAALGPFTTFAGVLFVYGPPGTRIKDEDRKTLRWVQSFCGPELFKNITVITTMWDDYGLDGRARNWARVQYLKDDYDMAPMLNPRDYHGAEFYHHGFPKGIGGPAAFSKVIGIENEDQRAFEIQDLIRRRYSRAVDCKPQIMNEVCHGVDLMATEAAKVLAANITNSRVRIRGDRAVVELIQEPQQTVVLLQQQMKPQPEIESGPKMKPEPEQKPTKSWPQSIFEWLEFAKQAAVFFADIRAAKATNKSKPTWGIWGTFKNWWSGAPPRDD